MNFLSQQPSNDTIVLITIVGILLLAMLCIWVWKKFRLGKLFRGSRKNQSLSAKSLAADQFVFDDDANELQSRLEAELSRQEGNIAAKGSSQSPSTEAAQQNTSGYFARKARNAKRTKQVIGLASDHDNTTIPVDADQYARIDKVELARLVSAVESLQSKNMDENVLQAGAESNANTTVIDAVEIERLSFHLESSNREIASLKQELTDQSRRIDQLEESTPDTLRRDSRRKITLLANSIIQRNTKVDSLAQDYKANVALAAQLAKSNPSQSQQQMQQCKVIKLQIKLQRQQLEKERLLMSEHTRVHRAMQLPKEVRIATLMQLVEQTNEIKNQNSNLKLLVDNINSEFGQLRSIVDGLKDSAARNQKTLNSQPRDYSGFDKGFDKDLAEKRIAANDAKIAGGAASSSGYVAGSPRNVPGSPNEKSD